MIYGPAWIAVPGTTSPKKMSSIFRGPSTLRRSLYRLGVVTIADPPWPSDCVLSGLSMDQGWMIGDW